MGVQNTALRPLGGVRLGATFMTGTLVSFGEGLGRALLGRGRRWRWSAHGFLWCAFSAGAATGAAAHAAFGFMALSGPAAVVAVAAAVCTGILITRRPSHTTRDETSTGVEPTDSAAEASAKTTQSPFDAQRFGSPGAGPYASAQPPPADKGPPGVSRPHGDHDHGLGDVAAPLVVPDLVRGGLGDT